MDLIRKGNKSSFLAAIVNFVLGLIKGVAYILTGNVAMFAEMMHSLGDAANQFFVFIGSALAQKEPTKRFPTGFGRVINLVCLGAVLIVAILSYETIKEGVHAILHPAEESAGIYIALGVLLLGAILESFVLVKAAKEILHDAGEKSSGVFSVFKAAKHLGKAKPASKLVFLEDSVATCGNLLAFAAILIAHFTGWFILEGIASVIIGIGMFFVVGIIFLDNARGAIGETDEDATKEIANLIMAHSYIKDIQRLEVIKEGEFLHVEALIETDKHHTLEKLDDVRDYLTEKINSLKGVTKVTILFDEDDGKQTWIQDENNEE